MSLVSHLPSQASLLAAEKRERKTEMRMKTQRRLWKEKADRVYERKGRLCNVCCWFITKSCLTLLWPHGLYPARLLCPWDLPGKNAGTGRHFLLQSIFLTMGLNWRLLHWQPDSLPLSHRGSLSFTLIRAKVDAKVCRGEQKCFGKVMIQTGFEP